MQWILPLPPANMNAVDNTGVWENGEDILNYVGYYDNESSYSGKKNYVNYIVEAEGILSLIHI